MNKISVLGNVVKEVELRFTKSEGVAIARITLAVNEGYGEKQTTTFVDVAVFGNQAVNCSKYLKKGSRILVSGALRQNVWEDKEQRKHYDHYILADKFNGIEFISNIISKEELEEMQKGGKQQSNNDLDNQDFTPVDDGDQPF